MLSVILHRVLLLTVDQRQCDIGGLHVNPYSESKFYDPTVTQPDQSIIVVQAQRQLCIQLTISKENWKCSATLNRPSCQAIIFSHSVCRGCGNIQYAALGLSETRLAVLVKANAKIK